MRISRYLPMALLIIAVGGCGSFPEPTPQEDSPDESRDRSSEQSPAQSTQTTKCEWTQQRGIAELVAIEESEGRFHFHPDGIAVTRSIHRDWAVGDEFKAILETPEPPDCAEERLIELRPLAPTD